jgi:hypothetical protein
VVSIFRCGRNDSGSIPLISIFLVEEGKDEESEEENEEEKKDEESEEELFSFGSHGLKRW